MAPKANPTSHSPNPPHPIGAENREKIIQELVRETMCELHNMAEINFLYLNISSNVDIEKCIRLIN